MLLVAAVILVVLWALGVFVARIASGLIHLIIILALVVFAMHVVRGRGMHFGGHQPLHERHFRP